jgi:trimeric autotransporter adhesin
MTSALVRSSALLLAACSIALPAAQSFASTCPFDTGGSDALNDGVVLTRYALGIAGAPMTASTRYASLDPLQVKANIECVGCALDMNGDNQVDAVDATIIARHLAGFTGASLTGGLALGAGSRNTTAAVTSFLANGCAVGGAINAFVQGGNAFGAPGVLGTNDAQPLTVKSGGTDIKVVNQRGDGLRVSFVNVSPNTINGSANNTVTAGLIGATIGGGGSTVSGYNNQVTGNDGTVSGGFANTAGDGAVVSGGGLNTATGQASTVAGGLSNTATGSYSIVAGGGTNTATGLNSTIVGGVNNAASGDYSIIAGGVNNMASGPRSFAAGSSANADLGGTFVWADGSTSVPFKATLNWLQPTFGANTFNVRATGGVMFTTSVNAAGAPVTSCFMGRNGTGWICSSDRNVKERIEPITPSRVLAGVLAMPVSTWSIIGSKVRQMGPMAQDFYRAFGLGDTDKAINSIDVGGVAFAAIQGLHELLKDKDAKIATLEKANAATQRDVALMKKRLGM